MSKNLLILLLFLGIFFSKAVMAKKTYSPAEQQVNWSEELKLSKEQKIKVAEIYEQSHQKIKSLMEQINVLHREIANVHNEDNDKIRALLDEKQQVKFDKIKIRMNKNNPEANEKGGKKPSRKRMRQYGGF